MNVFRWTKHSNLRHPHDRGAKTKEAKRQRRVRLRVHVFSCRTVTNASRHLYHDRSFVPDWLKILHLNIRTVIYSWASQRYLCNMYRLRPLRPIVIGGWTWLMSLFYSYTDLGGPQVEVRLHRHIRCDLSYPHLDSPFSPLNTFAASLIPFLFKLNHFTGWFRQSHPTEEEQVVH